MKTTLILVGKTADKHFQAGINDYAERISHYMPFEIVTSARNNRRQPRANSSCDSYRHLIRWCYSTSMERR